MQYRSCLFLLCVAVATPGFAQRLVKDDQIQSAEKLFRAAEEKPVSCSASWRGPMLDYALHYQVQFDITFPYGSFDTGDDATVLFVRVTPDGQAPRYLMMPVPMPTEVPDAKKTEINGQGAFLVGPGRYAADLVVRDKSGHSCSAHKIVGTDRSKEHAIESALPANSVYGVTDVPWKGPDASAKGTLTIFVHAAAAYFGNSHPIYMRGGRGYGMGYPRHPRLPMRTTTDHRNGSGNMLDNERNTLLASIDALVEHSGFAHFRVVAFNLDQQKEVFRDEDLGPDGMTKLARTLERLDLNSVPYTVAQHPEGAPELLLKLVHNESHESPRSDAVVFLGWPSHLQARLDKTLVQSQGEGAPAPVYLQYWRDSTRGAEFSDMIETIANGLGGRTYRVHNPGEFADDIGKLRQTAGAKARAAD